ncbi:MAG: choice-of-anchor tandem repeat GloVer-containing protein [Terriglobales bacterium]
MKNKRHASLPALMAMTLMFAAAVTNYATGQTFSVIDNLTGYSGAQILAGLIFDKAGNLYGTATEGGSGQGVVFEISPLNGGKYKETVLYKFGANGSKDGAYPAGGLIFDVTGDLYGTTQHGGAYNAGTVFELSPGANGWSETVLHSFGSSNDGAFPTSSLAIDSQGNLYGTTIQGGPYIKCSYSGSFYSCGTAFELSPVSGGSWTYKLIHSFGHNDDAYFPASGLTLDSAGNLFGECAQGGLYGKGTLYELSPGTGGSWTEQIVHQWGNGTDGSYPYGGLIFDSAGNLYGTTSQSGVKGNMGTVFELAPTQSGWVEQNQYYFGINTDGQFPFSGLLRDGAGNLYGTTHNGGSQGYGIVFELTPVSGGWTEEILYNLSGSTDGGISSATLVMDAAGNLYGTTWYGGNVPQCITGPVPGCGVVFKIAPAAGK